MSIVQDIASVIKEIVSEVIILEASYTHPLRDVPKPYPALVTLYDGFTRPTDEDDMDYFVTDLQYQLTLYLPYDGRAIEERWDELITLVWTLIVRFANDRTLGGNCRQSMITSGEPVVHVSGKDSLPVAIGHSFVLIARVETEDEYT